MYLNFSIFNHFQKILFFVLFFTVSFSGSAQHIQLTEQAQISVVVADPGTQELFEVFGHPAIRVHDPAKQIDLAFNYGIFDFDQPYFYLNFTRGYLNYMVAAWPYPAFENAYVSENRSLKEYVLNLTPTQKQKIFDFLAENVKPENRNYFYDYFYDNCSTRIWDVLEKTLGDDLYFDEEFTATGHSFRTLVDSLTVNKPWGDFGIDLCLGLPMDKKLSAYEYMYLPEFLGRSLAHASINVNGEKQALVSESNMVFESRFVSPEKNFFTPLLLFWSIFGLMAAITIIGYFTKIGFTAFDVLLFGVVGLVGLLLLILWVATDHAAAANNLNILWANPLYLPGVVFLLNGNRKKAVKISFLFFTIVLALFLITWPFNPQGLNMATVPIAITLLLRAMYIRFYLMATFNIE